MSRFWIRAAAAAPDTADLFIYAAIGREYQDGLGAREVIDALRGLPQSTRTIRVHVNSLGGSPFEAVAIANVLRDQRTTHGRAVVTIVEGIAASAATVITSAGRPVQIWDDALMMVHDPIAPTLGNAREYREMAAALEAVTEQILAAYRWISPKTTEALRALMAATTWMDADDALRNGLATEKVPASVAIAASACAPELLARLGEIPDRYRRRLDALARPAQPGQGLDVGAVYAARRAGDPVPHQAAARRPGSIGQLVQRYYGAGVGDVGDVLLRASARGGVE